MTRKRFVKLMMSKGYSRNEATETAKLVQGDGSYAETYAAICVIKSIPDIQQTIERFVDTTVRMMNAFADGVAAFTQAFRDSMNKVREVPNG